MIHTEIPLHLNHTVHLVRVIPRIYAASRTRDPPWNSSTPATILHTRINCTVVIGKLSVLHSHTCLPLHVNRFRCYSLDLFHRRRSLEPTARRGGDPETTHLRRFFPSPGSRPRRFCVHTERSRGRNNNSRLTVNPNSRRAR